MYSYILSTEAFSGTGGPSPGWTTSFRIPPSPMISFIRGRSCSKGLYDGKKIKWHLANTHFILKHQPLHSYVWHKVGIVCYWNLCVLQGPKMFILWVYPSFRYILFTRSKNFSSFFKWFPRLYGGLQRFSLLLCYFTHFSPVLVPNYFQSYYLFVCLAT